MLNIRYFIWYWGFRVFFYLVTTALCVLLALEMRKKDKVLIPARYKKRDWYEKNI